MQRSLTIASSHKWSLIYGGNREWAVMYNYKYSFSVDLCAPQTLSGKQPKNSIKQGEGWGCDCTLRILKKQQRSTTQWLWQSFNAAFGKKWILYGRRLPNDTTEICKRNCMKEIDELEMHAACICFKKPSKPVTIYQKQVHSGNQVTLWWCTYQLLLMLVELSYWDHYSGDC